MAPASSSAFSSARRPGRRWRGPASDAATATRAMATNRNPAAPARPTPGMVSAAQAPPMKKVRLRVRLEPLGGLLHRDVAGLDLFDHGGVLGRGSDGLRLGGEVALGPAQRVGGGPHAALVERREDLDGLAPVRAGGQVGGAEAHQRGGRRASRGRAGRAGCSSPSASVNSAVTSRARSTSTMRCRPVVGRNTARCRPLPLLELEVQPGSGARQGADELADEALALDPTHPGHDRQPGVEVEREGVLPGFDDQPLHSHGVVIGAHGA